MSSNVSSCRILHGEICLDKDRDVLVASTLLKIMRMYLRFFDCQRSQMKSEATKASSIA